MHDETPFSSIIEDLKYQPCPSCGAKEIAVSQQHSSCLKCGWIGPTESFTKDNVILKSILAQESFINLTATTKSSLKNISFGIARDKNFPGADSIHADKEFGAARCFVNKINEFGEETDIPEFMLNRTFKSFKLGVFNFLEKISSVAARSIAIEGENSIKKFTAPRIPTPDQLFGRTDAFLVNPDGMPSPELFRKKSVVEVDSSKTTEEKISVNVYSATFGRPDTYIEASYNRSGGIIKGEYPQMFVSPRATIWQPLYWPGIDLSSDILIRLVGVLQGGAENLNYIVTECMDTGKFTAGVYKRDLYESKVNFIQSKADTVEDAIRRLRTSFEKTVLKHENEDEPLDISWIKDWGYESTLDSTFYDILSAQFWDQALDCEMTHIIGYTKQQLLEEMYNEIMNDEQ